MNYTNADNFKFNDADDFYKAHYTNCSLAEINSKYCSCVLQCKMLKFKHKSYLTYQHNLYRQVYNTTVKVSAHH